MRRLAIAASLAALCAATGPAAAQSYQVQQRWNAAQSRYAQETQVYQRERDIYLRSGGRPGPSGQQGYYQGQAPQGYYGGQQGYYQGQQQGYQGQQGYYQGQQGQYRDAPPPAGTYANDERDEGSYDPSRYYRSGSNYQERTLSANDRVYAGQDGRYYCKRSDGTTGLIVGAAGGGILGNVIDGGHSRGVGTLIGGALGALVGKSVEQQQSSIRCR